MTVGVGGGWEMKALLELNPVSDPKLKKRLLEKGDVNAFVSWLLYAYSPEGNGIKSPSNLAISNISRDPKQGAKQIYLELARRGPDHLYELLDDLEECATEAVVPGLLRGIDRVGDPRPLELVGGR